MNSRKKIYQLLAAIALLLFGMALSVYLVDPFFITMSRGLG